MLKEIHFKNVRVLRDTTLPLEPFTLIVGPNGSGKSTALQALQAVARRNPNLSKFLSAGLDPRSSSTVVEMQLRWAGQYAGTTTTWAWSRDGMPPRGHARGPGLTAEDVATLDRLLEGVRVYLLEADRIARPVPLVPRIELGVDGSNLAGVLDRLRDEAPERFESLNAELGRWLREFDRVLFDTPNQGQRAFRLRARGGSHSIPAPDVSQGTLLALAVLTLAYLPEPPSIIGLEEPDRGIHPRLLREVRDALYRLAYPKAFGEDREPVQVIATTHSPYFLDLFREHPEEVVVAQRIGQEARFERLTDRADLAEILGDAALGEVWYSGILGGVPAEQ